MINQVNSSKFFFRTYALLVFVWMYFLFPKINLIPISNFNLRLQDYISIIIFFLMWSIKIDRKVVFFLLLFCLFQFLIGFIYNQLIGVVFILRLMQYILIGYAVYLLINSNLRKTFFYISFGIIFIYSLLQFFLFIPNLDPGRGILYSTQFSGPFSTSAELSYFITSTFLFFFSVGIFQRSLVSFLISLNGVIFAPLIYFAISSLKTVILRLPRTLIIFLPYLFIFLLATYFIDLDILMAKVVTPEYQNLSELQKGKSLNLTGIDGPLSFLFRVNKFLDIIIYMLNNPLIILFGCGYGCGMGAIDSGIIRILLEFGLIIPFLFMFIRFIPKYFLACFLGVNLLFDVFWSSQVAPILFAAMFYINYLKE